jgi:uncharacterized repeat protein (TIGR01451 family)
MALSARRRRHFGRRVRKHARPSPINAAARLWALSCLLLLFAALPGSLAFAKEPVDTMKAPAEEPVAKPTEPPAPAPAPEATDEPAEEADKPAGPEADEEDAKPADETSGGSNSDRGDDRAQRQPPPQPGTVKISGVDIDDIPQNQPHQGCVFVIEFRGFEGNGLATATLELIPPTPGNSTTASITLQDDPAGGANDLDGVLVINALDIPGFDTVPPHPIQGHHVRLDVDVQGVHKSKVFWVEQCAPGPQPVSGIAIFKSCPEVAEVGETITYEITVQNTGDDDLDITSVVDSLLGDITAEFPDILPEGDSASASVDFDTSGLEPGPLENTVTVTAVGEESGAEVTDTAECILTLEAPPVSDIDVSKSCPPAARLGRSITYTITVANTGEDELVGLTVEDTLLGDLSGFFPDSLPVGGSATQQFAREIVSNDPDPLVNTVTASATGAETGDTVSDVDSCRTNVLIPPGGVIPPAPPPELVPAPLLPVTGADPGFLLRLMLVLSLSGLGLLYLDRRREEDAQVAYATAQGPVVPGGMLTYSTSSLVGEGAEVPNAREAALGLGMILAIASGLATRRDV